MTTCLAAALTALSIAVDGSLDEPEWETAAWKDGVAVLSDAHHVYVGVRGDRASVDFSPADSKFEFYRFAFAPEGKDCTAQYFSESGNIQPDPYAPFWPHKSAKGKDGLTHEAAIPLSAFYMTRNRSWKMQWLVRRNAGKFEEEKGFPVRSAEEDVAIRSANACIDRTEGGALAGELKLAVYAAKGGDFTLKTSAGADGVPLKLRSGENKVSVPCRFGKAGRTLVHFAMTRQADGTKTGRSYPVWVEYHPVALRLTKPAYRGNFYPGQPVERVEGVVTVAGGGEAVVSLEGPGFTRQERKTAGDGRFAFDVRGFEKGGTATLVAKSGGFEERRTIRNLPPTGRQMVWIEDGHLVVDGKPVLRRNIYADKWMTGKLFMDRYGPEEASFRKTSAFEKYVHISPDWLIRSEAEAKKDVRPSDAYFTKLDAVIEKNRDTDFGYYYICDEPECRGISPVYLKHIYDHVAEKDPYHPVLTASRGGKAYVGCADWFETHPYLGAKTLPDGTRTYWRHPNEMGDFVDAFELADRPDKVVGFLPTCFASSWVSYPTFDEYVLHTWAAMMRGGKSLWPYAGHDMGDRPSIYEGTKYVFSSFAALEDLVLNGTRTTFARSKELEGVLYALPDEKMLVAVNFTDGPRQVELPKTDGVFREFRGERTFALSATAPVRLELAPLETLVACTKAHDRGLRTLAETKADIVRKDAERRGRDNQLRGRYGDVQVTSNVRMRDACKLFDGTLDMLACYSDWKKDAFVELAFVRFTPRFSKVRLWGVGDILGKAVVSARSRGEWRKLVPKGVSSGRGFIELDFGEAVSAVKLRLDFPGGPKDRGDFELCEVELPRCAGGSDGVARKAPEPLADAGVQWDLGPRVETNFFSRSVRFDPRHRWLVVDVASFRPLRQRGYRSWSVHLRDSANKSRYLGGTVTSPSPGLYTFEVPEELADGTNRLQAYIYGLAVDFRSIALMERPANRLELDYRDGVARIRAHFAEPCEDVAAAFLMTRDTGGMHPFPVNGTSGIDLKPLDGDLRDWGADIAVETCGKAGARAVCVRVRALGGGLERPLFSTFSQAFEAKLR